MTRQPDSKSADIPIGTTAALWRYPVKSMQGEALEAATVTRRGLLGDRGFALLDRASGMVASAKNPRKWQALFGSSAAYVEPPEAEPAAPVRIRLPGGGSVISATEGCDAALSQALGRSVALIAQMPFAFSVEVYTPRMADLCDEERVDAFEIPQGSFFDSAAVHIVTTASLSRLGELYPEGTFAAERFRPNLVVDTGAGPADFVENAWVGRMLAIGEEVRLRILQPSRRCVMTTLGQGQMPADSGILRTAARHNEACVGVYASVVEGGRARRGDPVRLV